MKKIDEMIKQLCPNGVEMVPLWSVTAWDKKFNAVDKSMQSKIIKYPYLLAKDLFALDTPEGSIKLLSTGTQSGWTTEEKAGNYLCDGEVVTIPWGKSSKVINLIKYYKGKFVTADNRIATSLDKDILNNKYLFYWMLSESDVIDSYYRGAGIKHPSMYNVLTMQIPLPPLSIQEEIVSVLDKFSELIEKTDEEIALRQKQYEYYREKLLTFEDGEVEWKKLGNLCDIVGRIGFRGYTTKDQVPAYTGALSLSPGNIVDNVMDYSKGTFITWEKYEESPEIMVYNDDIIFCKTGSTVGKVAMIKNLPCKATINPQLVVLKNVNINKKYLYYNLVMKRVQMLVTNLAGIGSVPNISQTKLSLITIPLPSLSRQQEIVDILDKFEVLISKLKGERELRQKQYEYYRDNLLTF